MHSLTRGRVRDNALLRFFMLGINTIKESSKIVQFIKKTLQDNGFSKCIIGLSGGLDSSTCLMLAVQALGPKNVLVVKLPYAKQDMSDANTMIKLCKIPSSNVYEINIKPILDQYHSTIQPFSHSAISNLRHGNLMARTRMTILYDLAKANNTLVCGTENKTENLLGYFTLFGDQACDFAPIKHLYKTQVRALAQYLKIPKNIILKPPTAGLWSGQTDEKELGFTYQEADEILYLLFDKKMKVNELIKKGFAKNLILKVLTRLKNNIYKHQIPYLITT